MSILKRLFFDECGQDIIEYAILGAGIAIVGVVTWENISDILSDKYVDWETSAQSLWDPDLPIAQGS